MASTGEPVFHIRDLKSERDVGAVNENFRGLADYVRKEANRSEYTKDLTFSGDTNNSGTSTFGKTSFTNASTFTAAVEFESSATFKGMVSIFDNISQSSATANLQAMTYTQPIAMSGSCCQCVGGSTLTWTSDGTPVFVELMANVNNQSVAGYFDLGYLLDSVTTVKMTYEYIPQNIGSKLWFRDAYTPTAAAHTLCLFIAHRTSYGYTLNFGGYGGGNGKDTFLVRPQR